MSERVYQPKSSAKEYRLGNWTLCVHANCLRRDDLQVELEHRLVLLLLLFIDHPNEVLSKERILKTIWQGKVVNDDSLAVAISYLRKALADNSRAPEYIKTIPGVGYQFIATAEPLLVAAETQHVSIMAVDISRSSLYKKPALIWGASIALVLLLVVFTVFFVVQQPDIQSSPVQVDTTLPLELQQQIINAQQALQSGSANDWRTAIQIWRDLLNQHPNNAEAYAGIAQAKIKLLGDQLAIKENCAEVLGLLDKAVELDDQLATAYQWRANALFWCRRDYVAAEQNYQQAIALQSKDDAIPMNYAQLLLAQGRFEESLVQVNKSRQLNPLNYSVPTVVWIYQMQRRDDLALQELERITSAEPDNRYHHISAQRVYARLGREADSLAHWLWLMGDAQYSEQDLYAAQTAFDSGGLVAVNRWLLVRKDDADLGQYTPPLSWARYALAAGNADAALDYLEQAFVARQSPLLWAAVDPAYDLVRDHPRFQAIIATLQHIEQ